MCLKASVVYLFIQILIADAVTLPQWHPTYKLTGTLFVPAADIEEPFVAWYNSDKSQSRIDYFTGSSKSYQSGKPIEFGQHYFFNNDNGELHCASVNGSAQHRLTLQAALPVVKGFVNAGTEEINGNACEKWQFSTINNELINNFTVWIKRGKGKAIPVRYEMFGYNTIVKGNYDYYFIEYDSYTTDPIDAQIFEINNGIECDDIEHAYEYVYKVNPLQEFIHPVHTSHADEAFEEFKSKYGKRYFSPEQEINAKGIFIQTARFIYSHNRQDKPYKLKINQLADASEMQLSRLTEYKRSTKFNGATSFPYRRIDLRSMPKEFDWRNTGDLSPVKDQGICASGWVFAALGTVEGAYLASKNRTLNLAAQPILDCSRSFRYETHGCAGGDDFKGLKYIIDNGAPADKNHRYHGSDGYCVYTGSPEATRISRYVNVTARNEAALKFAVFKKGPVSVTLDASNKAFNFYSHGVYYETGCSNQIGHLNHAALVVGYGMLKEKPYWIIKNSFSANWGLFGYMLMSMRDNDCGVTTVPTYAVI